MTIRKFIMLIVVAFALFAIDFTYSNFTQPVMQIKKDLKQLLIKKRLFPDNQVRICYINGGKLFQSENNLYSYYFLVTDLSSFKIIFLVCQYKNETIEITNVTEEKNSESITIYTNPLGQ